MISIFDEEIQFGKYEDDRFCGGYTYNTTYCDDLFRENYRKLIFKNYDELNSTFFQLFDYKLYSSIDPSSDELPKELEIDFSLKFVILFLHQHSSSVRFIIDKIKHRGDTLDIYLRRVVPDGQLADIVGWGSFLIIDAKYTESSINVRETQLWYEINPRVSFWLVIALFTLFGLVIRRIIWYYKETTTAGINNIQ